MPFELRSFVRMFRLAFRDPLSRRRRRVVVFLFLAIPSLAAMNAVCFLLDRLLFPGYRRVPVRAPVFIIGHARSGTSLLHRLLSRDERFSYFRTYEMFVPSLFQKKLIRALGRFDRERLGGRIARRVEAFEDRAFAKGRQMHPMSLTGPEEDEFLLALSCASAVVVTLFPYMRELDYLYYFDERPARDRRRVLRFYAECVKRQLYLNGAHKTHLAKNPVFCGKVASLIEAFPDARFVVTLRDPCETIPSLLKMTERNWKASGCPRARIDESLPVLARQSIHTYRYPLEVLQRHPEVPRAYVDYEELVAHPRRSVEAVYAKLGLPVTPEFRASLEQEETRAREHRAEHVYTLEEFGLSREAIREQLADLYERFGWGETNATRAQRG